MIQPSPFTIQPEVVVDPSFRLSDHDLIHLSSQRRTFNRLDWWSPYEWKQSNAYAVCAVQGKVSAGLLYVPVAFDDINVLESARSASCWLRWCALADGVSASTALSQLFAYSHMRLHHARITQAYCIIENTHWFHSYLRESGYSRADDVITMACRKLLPLPVTGDTMGAWTIRPATSDDIREISIVDSYAFEEQWHYPSFIMRRALLASTYLNVAVDGNRIVGYQFASCTDGNAHITRLAVLPEFQGRGIGSALLADSMTYLRNQCNTRTVTINTQASNRISQKLYQRYGFTIMQPIMNVMCKKID